MFAKVLEIFNRYASLFGEGMVLTVYLSAISVFFGTVFGTLLCLLRGVKFKPIQWLATAYIEVVRGTPLLLQMFLVFFVVGEMLPFNITKIQSAIIALSANSAAYVAELIRSGIQAVDKGQTEAARSLGLSSGQTMSLIILPQAVRNILPALGNEFISVIKESSLGSSFFIGELMTVRAIITGALYLTIEPLIIVGCLYFFLTFTLSKVVGLIERRMAVSD